jgi:uncharacterized membrane protein YgcG
MPPLASQSSSAPEAGKGTPSFAARHGAALAAGATALTLLAFAAAFIPQRNMEPSAPPPAHWFDDGAKLVSPGYAAGKSEYLQQYLPLVLKASVLIVTEPRAPAGRIEDYTARAANGWRIGGQGRDDGVVLFVFREPPTLRLEVGYGLEGALPDIDAKHLVEATLVPSFSAGRYEEGFDDFLDGLQERLKAFADEADRRSSVPGLLEYVAGVLRQCPRVARSAWTLFREADTTGRIVLALFAAILASLAGYALSGIAAALIAIVRMPWRLATSAALRNLDRRRLGAEFSPAEFARHAPPSLVAVATELQLGTIAWGVLCVAGIMVAVAFAGLGTEVFIGQRGQFSGAGITTAWPQR